MMKKSTTPTVTDLLNAVSTMVQLPIKHNIPGFNISIPLDHEQPRPNSLTLVTCTPRGITCPLYFVKKKNDEKTPKEEKPAVQAIFANKFSCNISKNPPPSLLSSRSGSAPE